MGCGLFSLWTLVQVQADWKMNSAISERVLHVPSEVGSPRPHDLSSAGVVFSGGDARVGIGSRLARRYPVRAKLRSIPALGHRGGLVVRCVFCYRRCQGRRAIYQWAVAERSIHSHYWQPLRSRLLDTSFEPSRGALPNRTVSSPEHRNCGLWSLGLRGDLEYFQGWV